MDKRAACSLGYGESTMIVDPKGKEDFHIRYKVCKRCLKKNYHFGKRRIYVWSVDEEYWIQRCSQGHKRVVKWTTWEKMNAHLKRIYIPVVKKSLENSLAFYRRLDGPGPYELGPGKGFTIPLRFG
jgi:hypothetical protein